MSSLVVLAILGMLRSPMWLETAILSVTGQDNTRLNTTGLQDRLKKRKVKSLSRVQLFATPWTPGSSVLGILWARITGVGRHSLLQRIFPAQGSNPDLPHCRQIFCHLSHQGIPEVVINFIKCKYMFSSVQFSRSVVSDSL